METVFNYLEYRDYLKEHFDEQKRTHSFFSFRYIAAKIDIDASYYAKVLSHQKHIAENRIEDLATFLKLRGREREYFVTLVRFNRARSERDEKELFARLQTLKNSTGKTVESGSYRYFSAWYHVAIRELLTHYNYTGNTAELAQKLLPPIAESDAKRAIEILTDLALIKHDANGFLRPAEAILTTGDQWRSQAVRDFQRSMINHAAQALYTFPPEERDISSLTVSTSQSCLESIKEKLQQTRREILELINAEEQVDGVYQINFQVFPLSQQEVRS